MLNSQSIGNYKYEKIKIGRGSYSTVFKGIDIRNNNIVAIKKIDKYLVNNQNRLKYEIDVMKSLKHPNIVKLYDVIEDEEYYYLILEYCKLGDLAKFLKERPLKEKYTKKYMLQISHALKYLINKKIIHRDIKPHNLLLYDINTIKITDFGFARYFENDNMVETLCGSPIYMAPEIMKYKKYTIKADIWSLGIVFYEMLTGRPPFRAKTHYELIKIIDNDDLSIPIDLNLSINCINLLKDMLIKNPTNRIDWESFFTHPWFLISSMELDESNNENIHNIIDSVNINVKDDIDDIDDKDNIDDIDDIDNIDDIDDIECNNDGVQIFEFDEDYNDNVCNKDVNDNNDVFDNKKVEDNIVNNFFNNDDIIQNYYSTAILGSSPMFIEKRPMLYITNVTKSDQDYEIISEHHSSTPLASNRDLASSLMSYMNHSINYLKTYLI